MVVLLPQRLIKLLDRAGRRLVRAPANFINLGFAQVHLRRDSRVRVGQMSE